jgi:hypothetical protein
MTTTVQDSIDSKARREASAIAAVPPLSALEWKVVALAMREAGDIGRGWFAQMFDRFIGLRPKLPLADPRLETLRRFVGRLRSQADVSELKLRLVELGFHPGQISAVARAAR